MPGEWLSIARGRLIQAAPYLAVAFNRLRDEPRAAQALPATDGEGFYFDPEWLRRDCEADGRAVSAALAHCTAHCLLGHVFEREADALAADMAVALLLDERLPAYCPAHGAGLFLEAKRRLSGVALSDVPEAMAADGFFREHGEALTALLRVDAHDLWTGETPLTRLSGGGAGAAWQAEARRLARPTDGRRAGLEPGAQRRRVRLGDGPNRAYGALLRRYAEERENPREDPNAFQPGLYSYGLAMYGNMPLVEPAELRQERRIEELAVVIDTSGSCIRELTVHFLEETRALLTDETLFFRRFNLHILQCDARVRRVDRITCARDFERYIDRLEIVGGGGTNFCPAFETIDALIARGVYRRLPCALFFSDGRGVFPSGPLDYDAVFAFYRNHYDPIDVPGWVRRLVLEPPEGLR